MTALDQLTAGRGGREEWVSWAVLGKSLGLGRELSKRHKVRNAVI